jgi:16S rRNA processing protein RimM
MGEAVVVGRIGRAHGIRGDVTVEVRTDVPDVRFAPGARLSCDPPSKGPLVVATSHWHSGRLLLGFEGVADRTAAEALRGVLLTIDSAAMGPADADGEDDVWWDRDLVGLAAATVDGRPLGVVSEVVHGPGGDLLAVRRPGGGEHLIPFVREFVPLVEPSAGRVVVDPPPGLLELG